MTPSEAIDHLLRSGFTEEAIGAAVGVRQSTVNRIKRGDMQPNYSVGVAIVDMAVASKPATASCNKRTTRIKHNN